MTKLAKFWVMRTLNNLVLYTAAVNNAPLKPPLISLTLYYEITIPSLFAVFLLSNRG